MHRPSTVLYAAADPQIGGGNRVLMDVMTALDPGAYRPVIVAPAEGPILDWARSQRFPAYAIPDGDWSGTAGLVRRTASLAGLMIRERVRLVHAGAPMAYRAAGVAAAIVGARRVCHLGGPPTQDELGWAFKSAPDVVIACHQHQAGEVAPLLERTGSRARLVAIPNGVDTRRFEWTSVNRERWRFGGCHVVLIVANLSALKGYPIFLEAARLVIDAIPECQFVALGGMTARNSGYQAELERKASDLGIRDRVHFLGWRSEVPEILSAADVMVLPSLLEGLPLSVLEAMACERPVIATRVGGIPEAMLDGITGALIEPRQLEPLASAIVAMLRAPERAAEMGRAGRRRVEEHFSLERVAADVDRVYRTLLN